MNALLTLLAASLMAAEAADLRKPLARCAALEGELVRLACFDALTEKHGLKKRSVARTPAGAGRWHVEVEKNPLDDSKTVTALLTAESGKSTFGRPIDLAFRCLSGKTELIIAWDSYLGMDATPVVTRLDDAEARTQPWSLSTDHKATFFPRGVLREFLPEFVRASRLVAQVTPYGDSPITAIFDVRGVDAVVKQLQDACEVPGLEVARSTTTTTIDTPAAQ